MKNHVLRPLWLALAAVALFLAVRYFLVPADFGVHGRNFTYGFHRLGNIQEWRAFPPRYQGNKGCAKCHSENYRHNMASPHAVIQCENCHGAALGHPDLAEGITIDTSRDLCLRCHAALPYPTSERSVLPAVDPENHNAGVECRECHDPHNPDLEGMK
ncbi:MAG: cytochrome C [Deltaproteobacteria bacterium]|nr:cytochrome C [Deltaproteobacteria bacterium]